MQSFMILSVPEDYGRVASVSKRFRVIRNPCPGVIKFLDRLMYFCKANMCDVPEYSHLLQEDDYFYMNNKFYCKFKMQKQMLVSLGFSMR